MSLSKPWMRALIDSVRKGLTGLYKEPPLTAVEWADKHFYLSSESSYQEGRWTTAPFQVAILNAMGNDLIAVVNVLKSARVGYTKMLVANKGYKIQHKKRNVLSWCPTDPDADTMMKRHIETMIRDVPLVRALAPWYGVKHRDNTLDEKRFDNSKMLWCLGGKAARNYREKSPDEVIYDELSKFDADIEGEGSPTMLGDKRLEGATFPKSIRGSTPGVTLNPMQMVGMAFTHGSSDFGQILLDIAGKSVLLGWEEAPETFQLWTKKGQLSDFKTSSRVGLGEFPSLREVRPGAEYKHITLSDRGEPITLATYGEMFSITRQAIINDDLSLLSGVPYKMGQAARATIGDLVYAVLTSPPKMRDGKSLFDASRKNNAAGPASELSIASLIAGKTAMASQKTQVDGGKARTLNIRPAYVLTPVALEDKANQIINSASVPGADANSGIINPIRGFAKVIGEPRLDDNSSSAWYMAAKQGSDTIEVAYLNGIDTPYVEQQNGFSVDGVASKVRIDAGVAPSDYRGLYSAAGK